MYADIVGYKLLRRQE